MKRDLVQLSRSSYDMVVVGGGIFGICAAWEAASRGLSVALVEKGDFAGATSANSFKIVHGGIRYLQHADIKRVRESCKERTTLLRIAPHLVRPLPIVMPTYGHGLQGKEILNIGLLLYDLLTFDRNRGVNDPGRHIPRGRFISREECLDIFPGLNREGLTGAAIFYDGQMYNPTRLAISFLRSAVDAGADVANYVQVTDFISTDNRITGVRVEDTLNGNTFEIRGKVVINAAGPWANWLLKHSMGFGLTPEPSFSRDACFVVRRKLLSEKYALAVPAKTRDPDALLSRGNRHLFIAPWRDYTLIGVWHKVFNDAPDKFVLTGQEVQKFIDEVNEAYPRLELTPNDVSIWNAGLILFGDSRQNAADLSFGKRSLIVDHAKDSNVEGLITLIGVRYTTARGIAEKALDMVFKKLGKRARASATAVTPVHGGQIECFDEYLRMAVESCPKALNPRLIPALIHNYGSAYTDVLKYIDQNPAWSETLGESTVIEAEVVHAVREEMAQKLGDVIFRRTDLATGEHPGEAALQRCAYLMAAELGWDEGRVQRELSEVKTRFPEF
ncbi:MAG TPA: glycerol-3-phosphate dehydrogenase/oxidase [Thermodesulfobacteriota bacterium]|nr:glycerol-3-phosphate dehydrogenase/oxidase [Thermodesulfobacteriota bacterium]